MKEQNIKELLIDLKDFMDMVQSPATPALFLKRDIENYLNQNKSILYFTNDKNILVKYDDENIVISHDNETGEFTFNRIRFRGDAGELLTPHYK